MIDHARILYNRCLYTESLTLIDKAKKRARTTDNFLLLLELLELEKLAVMRSPDDYSENRVRTIIGETEKTAMSISNINTFSNLALRLTNLYQRSGFLRNTSEEEHLHNLLFSSLPDYNEKDLSFHEKMYLYQSLTGYYFFRQEMRKGLVQARKWVKLFEDQPQMIRLRTEMYIRALNSLLVVQNKLSRYDEFMQTHRKLVAIKRNKEIILTENINLNLFKAIYIHEINRHFMLGEFSSGVRIVARLESELNTFLPQLDKNTVILFYYKIACLYFGASQFRQALKWLNKIIQFGGKEIREDLQAFARIVRLICFFELENSDMMDYSTRSLYRSLLKEKNFPGYTRLLLDFLKEDPRPPGPDRLKARFRRLRIAMQRIKRDPYEKRAFYYFDILSWLDSRIENRSVQEVIQGKNKAKKTT
jgi:tetratricopeptide (TPR) repeat protein